MREQMLPAHVEYESGQQQDDDEERRHDGRFEDAQTEQAISGGVSYPVSG